jgi:hypothetical protein
MTAPQPWTGKTLTPDAAEAVLNITFHGYGLARDFAHLGLPDWHWFVQAAAAVEHLDQNDDLVLWTIGAYLNRFPVRYDEDGLLVFGPPEEALMPLRLGLRDFDRDAYHLALRRREHARRWPGVPW